MPLHVGLILPTNVTTVRLVLRRIDIQQRNSVRPIQSLGDLANHVFGSRLPKLGTHSINFCICPQFTHRSLSVAGSRPSQILSPPGRARSNHLTIVPPRCVERPDCAHGGTANSAVALQRSLRRTKRYLIGRYEKLPCAETVSNKDADLREIRLAKPHRLPAIQQKGQSPINPSVKTDQAIRLGLHRRFNQCPYPVGFTQHRRRASRSVRNPV